jgi:hypothetical protein
MADDYLTMAEIEAKYPNEWVLIAEPKSKRGSQAVLGGRVAFHTPDRDELDRRLDEFRHITRGAILYTGKPDPDEIWLLNL